MKSFKYLLPLLLLSAANNAFAQSVEFSTTAIYEYGFGQMMKAVSELSFIANPYTFPIITFLFFLAFADQFLTFIKDFGDGKVSDLFKKSTTMALCVVAVLAIYGTIDINTLIPPGELKKRIYNENSPLQIGDKITLDVAAFNIIGDLSKEVLKTLPDLNISSGSIIENISNSSKAFKQIQEMCAKESPEDSIEFNECYTRLVKTYKVDTFEMTPQQVAMLNSDHEKEMGTCDLTDVGCQFKAALPEFMKLQTFQDVALYFLSMISNLLHWVLMAIVGAVSMAWIVFATLTFLVLKITTPLLINERTRDGWVKNFRNFLSYALIPSLVVFMLFVVDLLVYELVKYTVTPGSMDKLLLGKVGSDASFLGKTLLMVIVAFLMIVAGYILKLLMLVNVTKFAKGIINNNLDAFYDIGSTMLQSVTAISAAAALPLAAAGAAGSFASSGVSKIASSAQNGAGYLQSLKNFGKGPNPPAGPGTGSGSNFSNGGGSSSDSGLTGTTAESILSPDNNKDSEYSGKQQDVRVTEDNSSKQFAPFSGPKISVNLDPAKANQSALNKFRSSESNRSDNESINNLSVSGANPKVIGQSFEKIKIKGIDAESNFPIPTAAPKAIKDAVKDSRKNRKALMSEKAENLTSVVGNDPIGNQESSTAIQSNFANSNLSGKNDDNKNIVSRENIDIDKKNMTEEQKAEIIAKAIVSALMNAGVVPPSNLKTSNNINQENLIKFDPNMSDSDYEKYLKQQEELVLSPQEKFHKEYLARKEAAEAEQKAKRDEIQAKKKMEQDFETEKRKLEEEVSQHKPESFVENMQRRSDAYKNIIEKSASLLGNLDKGQLNSSVGDLGAINKTIIDGKVHVENRNTQELINELKVEAVNSMKTRNLNAEEGLQLIKEVREEVRITLESDKNKNGLIDAGDETNSLLNGINNSRKNKRIKNQTKIIK